MMNTEVRTLQLAERIASLLADLEQPCALVGSVALAVHNYVRATRDLDLGVSILDVKRTFARLRDELPDTYRIEVRYATPVRFGTVLMLSNS